MDISAIGSMSIQMHLAQTQQAVGVTMLKKSMDMQEMQTDFLVKSLEAAAPPPSNHKLDMTV